ncbi:AcrR family transcriptional regulator [Pseudarthrobacter sp. PvP004]|uniref:TetR/AcrR family transcriptional regulator n=1 Tax=Pseudarthrobacter sp. PvP004 TaxID=2817850 RepID=UPI001AE48776|nr:TetR/AcrR family transcriptional regulator [Pseudarthrobacter sp. PvP004]MBP2266232.1 AcrR family transcriptional regulator [Pseudarthrobacter sp. PvP004]
MDDRSATPSARQVELLEAAYQYVLQHGISGLSLRPLAAAIGSSTRVLLFLFGSKEGLIRALLDRARAEELEALHELMPERRGLAAGVEVLWEWLSSEVHRPLLLLWVESYSRSLADQGGPWADFAQGTVTRWLDILAQCQDEGDRISPSGEVERTLALAVLRGALLDLLATSDVARSSAAVRHYATRMNAQNI